VGATRVEYYCDGSIPLGTNTVAPYTASTDTTKMANGTHTLLAKAYDAAGNSTTSAANTVTVNNTVQTGGPWTRSFGGTGADAGSVVAVDSNGNIFVAGYFSGTMNLGGAPLVGATPGWNLFIAKYSSSGAFLWAKNYGYAGSFIQPFAIALDGAGN